MLCQLSKYKNSKLSLCIFFHDRGAPMWKQAYNLSSYVCGSQFKETYHLLTVQTADSQFDTRKLSTIHWFDYKKWWCINSTRPIITACVSTSRIFHSYQMCRRKTQIITCRPWYVKVTRSLWIVNNKLQRKI